MDLNVDNYSLDDLLALFKLTPTFSKEEFVAAKRIVLATHPDKSGLDKEYFLFFAKAYKLLHNVHKIKHAVSTSYEPASNDANRELARQFSETENFSTEFNSLFEKHYVASEEERHGFGDWLKSPDVETSFEERKRESRAVVKNVEACISHSMCSSLDGDTYTDLKRAYTVDTVIGVSDADFRERPSLETLKLHRAEIIPPSSNAESILAAHREEDDAADTRRAFKLMRQDEAGNRQRQGFWGHLLRLT